LTLEVELKLELRPYLSSNVADASPKSAKDHKLGSLLNHQLLNPVLAHL